MEQELLQFISETPKNIITQRLRMKRNQHLLSWIDEQIQDDIHLHEKIYLILHPGESLICSQGNMLKFRNIDTGYGFCGTLNKCFCHREHLSKFCGHSGDTMQGIIEKRKETWMEKYGYQNAASSPIVKEKRRSTIEKKRSKSTNKAIKTRI